MCSRTSALKTAPIGDDILPMLDMTAPKGSPVQKVVVHRRQIMVAGERLIDASAGFDSRTGLPAIELRFDSVGARQFGDTTKANVGKPFAVILDGQVIQVANITEPILGGTAQITGNFTTEYATNVALLMRSGALPAPLNIIQESFVGPQLGDDSIKAGRISAIAGLALVALFMVLRYGLFGIFADLALTLNLVLLLAALTGLHATLTLPGIAGIVLTLGMAVDANVLIFERIREEQRNGRGMLGAIDAGFKRAMATIIDANATHLIAAAVLFELGSGPVKGFAVALFLGIITSFFTSVVVTRLIVSTWLNIARPRRTLGRFKSRSLLFRQPWAKVARRESFGEGTMAAFFGNLRNVVIAGFVLAIGVAAIYVGCLHGGIDATFWAAVTRWLHVAAGVMWIGLLWYFNFVQVPTMPSVPAELKPGVTKYIAPAALFWFRWAALATVVWAWGLASQSASYTHGRDALIVLGLTSARPTPPASLIGLGMWPGLIMGSFNVWFIIWPNQQKVLNLRWQIGRSGPHARKGQGCCRQDGDDRLALQHHGLDPHAVLACGGGVASLTRAS